MMKTMYRFRKYATKVTFSGFALGFVGAVIAQSPSGLNGFLPELVGGGLVFFGIYLEYFVKER